MYKSSVKRSKIFIYFNHHTMMRIFLLLLTTVLTSSSALVVERASAVTISPDNHKVSFILDFLKAQSKPTHTIIWKNCFTNEEKFELVKRSSSCNFNPTTFNRQDSLNRSDFGQNPQFTLFILDLTCTQSPERIIHKVNIIVCDFLAIILTTTFFILL